MHQTGFVACIKVNGKILRESDDTVSLPFGSSYSILIKNLNSVRSQVKVFIDGTDATDGTHLVIPASGGEIELERFIRNANLTSGNKLKFIERSDAIESHRGIKAEDGLILVEAWKEKITPVLDVPVVRHHYHDYHHYLPKRWPFFPTHPPYTYGFNFRSFDGGLGGQQVGTTSCNVNQAATSSTSFTETSAAEQPSKSIIRGIAMNAMFTQSDAGITVAGAESNQAFRSVSGFPLEAHSTVIVLRLRGQIGKKAVTKPVTVKSSKKCGTCGKSNKGGGKFCSGCGASLVLI